MTLWQNDQLLKSINKKWQADKNITRKNDQLVKSPVVKFDNR